MPVSPSRIRGGGGGAAVEAAWVAGAFCCYFPAKRWNLAHINTISLHWVPFAMLSLHRLLERPNLARAVVAGVMVTLAGLEFTAGLHLALAAALPAFLDEGLAGLQPLVHPGLDRGCALLPVLLDDLLDTFGTCEDIGKDIHQDDEKSTLASRLGADGTRQEVHRYIESAASALAPLGPALSLSHWVT